MADEVILYQEENFVKAFGNVKLQNADGSIITADEMEYDGNTERGIARKNVVLTDPKQTIKYHPKRHFLLWHKQNRLFSIAVVTEPAKADSVTGNFETQAQNLAMRLALARLLAS